MVDKSVRDRIKQDFLDDVIQGTDLEGRLRGIGFGGTQENPVIRINIPTGYQGKTELPEVYHHKTGDYPVQVNRIGEVRAQ